jgi:hypothetical protein
MSTAEWLSAIANLAAIVTAIVAVWAFAHFQVLRLNRKARLEAFVQGMHDMPDGCATVIQCMATVGMTESEVMHAAQSSDKISLRARPEHEGTPEKLILEYNYDGAQIRQMMALGRHLDAHFKRRAQF